MPLSEAINACQEDHPTLSLCSDQRCDFHNFEKHVLNYFPLLSIVPVGENKKLTFSIVFVFFARLGKRAGGGREEGKERRKRRGGGQEEEERRKRERWGGEEEEGRRRRGGRGGEKEEIRNKRGEERR